MSRPIIVHCITSLKMGGAESLLVDFLSHPAACEFTHYVIFFHDGPNRELLEKQGISCFKVKGFIRKYDPVFFFRLYSLIKRLKPDCLHTWLWSANVAGRIVGRLLGISVLNSFHSEVDMDGFVRNTLDRYTYHMSNRLIAVSYGVAGSLIEGINIPSDKLKIIKNGINVESVVSKSNNNRVTRADLDLDESHFVIGSVGRWIACKNYPLLLNAFAHLYSQNSALRLLLVGSGPEKRALQDLTQSLGVENAVIFIEGKVAYGYYPIFDCFVQTSFKEGISIALLEAMSCSLPCIITTQQGFHEVIVHTLTGIIVPSYDYEQLALAIEGLIGNKKQAKLLGNNAHQAMKSKFSLDSMISSYYKEYRQLINFNNQNL